MKKNKKGISPLIATIILIGFVIVVAILIFVWYRSYTESIAEKQGFEIEGSTLCAQDVQFNVVCADSSQIVLENTGTTVIDDFRLKSDDEMYGTKLLGKPLSQGPEAVFSFNEIEDGFSFTSEIEVFPVVVVKGSAYTCSEKSIKVQMSETGC